MTDYVDPNRRVDAVWCSDSETGGRYLIDRLTGQVIAQETPNEAGDTGSQKP